MTEADKVGADGTLRIGVVGVGVMGSNHARVLSELPGVKLVGVYILSSLCSALRSGMPCATSSSPLSSARSWSCAVGRANGAIANLRRIRGQHLCNAGSELTGWEGSNAKYQTRSSL